MFRGNRRELKPFQSEYPGGGAVPTDQWNLMVCAADTNGDGRMGIDEFKGVYRRLQSGDYGVLQEAGARCAGWLRFTRHQFDHGYPGLHIASLESRFDKI